MARLFRTRHGVYSLGDARELIKEIPSGSVDAIITDPPYGVGKDRFDDGEVFFELEDELYRVLRDHGWLIFFWSTKKLYEAFRLKRFRYVWMIIATRSTGHITPSPIGYSRYQVIMVFAKGNPRPCKRHFDLLMATGELPVIQLDDLPKQFKPTNTVSTLLWMFTRDGDVVLVPFAGYGSIPLTCELFGRRWIAFEIDREKYVFARKLVGSISGIEEER